MKDGIIRVADGRSVGYADYGMPDQIPLLWCHGAPSNRLEASFVAEAAARAGLRIIGIDRPGYGRSTPQPGRTIGGWVSDGFAVLDHLGIDRFVVVGASTGGAYALAVASSSPRVMCAVACCAVSDMRWPEGKAMNVSCHPVWNARDRENALAIVTAAFGAHGENLLPPRPPLGAPPSDVKLYDSPSFVAWQTRYLTEVFTQGPEGYVDDRLADANGWSTFDVTRITCPVAVLHGTADTLVPVANAYHTASIVPGATLHIVDELGHLSIVTETVALVTELLARSATR